jgi:predicted TIM-barrel fold metal-dependent hydrolase
MKIDIFAHILPSKYLDAVDKLTTSGSFLKGWVKDAPTLSDLDSRFRIMDKYEGYVQVLTISGAHKMNNLPEAAELAKIANDEVAELISRYPDRFVAGVATLPMNNMDAALMEVDRAINELKFRGAEIWAPTNGKPIDLPEFLPLYEKMSQYDLPIWIHPTRGPTYPDYSSENESKYGLFGTFGYCYETTIAMARLVFSHVLQKYPDLKFITHHCGGMVPYFAQRIVVRYDFLEMRRKETHKQGLTKPLIDNFQMFYNDTALNGSTPALMCAYAFFGAEHLLFATDMPFDSQMGDVCVRDTIRSVEQMDIPDSDKRKIFEDNARKILRLPV